MTVSELIEHLNKVPVEWRDKTTVVLQEREDVFINAHYAYETDVVKTSMGYRSWAEEDYKKNAHEWVFLIAND